MSGTLTWPCISSSRRRRIMTAIKRPRRMCALSKKTRRAGSRCASLILLLRSPRRERMPMAVLSSRPKHKLIVLSLLTPFLALVCFPVAESKTNAGQSVQAEHGMVVSVSAPASEVGVEILKKGGNAVDAAVATAFALAVTYPQAGNLGGGGFMLVYPGGKAEPAVIDYRETAPAAATRAMFAKQDGLHGYKVIGVPGTVRGLGLAHERFGKLPWKDVVKPALLLAEHGFPVSEHLAGSLNWIVWDAREFLELRRVYGKRDGTEEWHVGDRLVLKDLAWTLRVLAEEGPDALYQGPIADKIVAEMKSGGGLITKADLASYQAKLRTPIHGTYRGYDIYGPPPPSSGGICLVEMLNILENFELRKHERWSAETLHLMIESMRRAFCDRARYLGDSDFVSIPSHLTTKEYARELARGIDLHKATRSEDLAPDIALTGEGDSTTHF